MPSRESFRVFVDSSSSLRRLFLESSSSTTGAPSRSPVPLLSADAHLPGPPPDRLSPDTDAATPTSHCRRPPATAEASFRSCFFCYQLIFLYRFPFSLSIPILPLGILIFIIDFPSHFSRSQNSSSNSLLIYYLDHASSSISGYFSSSIPASAADCSSRQFSSSFVNNQLLALFW